MHLPKVVLIGRTNVGKSTIFNTLTEQKTALVSTKPGTTRDKKKGQCVWEGQAFFLIDTAGLDISTDELIDVKAIETAKKQAKEADLNLLVVDAKDGLLPQDKKYAAMLKKLNKPYLLIINKVDSIRQINDLSDFEKLGLGKSEKISAVTGAGTGDMLDRVLQLLKGKTKDFKDCLTKQVNIAIVGKPNVGKSSILNKIAGEEKVIVSAIAHTTRDSHDFALEVKHNEEPLILNFIDTAGIRKKRKIDSEIEQVSIEQSIEAIYKAQIVLLVIDADKNITQQDKNISGEILEQSKSLIIVVNKWDLIENKDEKSDQTYLDYLHRSFPYLAWAPVVFLSAKTGFKINRLLDLVLEIYDKQNLEISNSELENFLKYIIKKQSPRKIKGIKPPYLHSIKQVKTSPQTFELIADQPENIHFSYLRFIKNQLRERFKLEGVGIKLRKVPKKLKHNKKEEL